MGFVFIQAKDLKGAKRLARSTNKSDRIANKKGGLKTFERKFVTTGKQTRHIKKGKKGRITHLFKFKTKRQKV